MYYKITDKESELYKKLHELRTRELAIEERNRKAVIDKVGLEWDGIYGRVGQQHVSRVSTYSGFSFKDKTKVDPKVWVWQPSIDGFLPNKRTSKGKEMAGFLRDLETSSVFKLFSILGFEFPERFTYPVVDICDETIVLFTGSIELTDPCAIEITSVEFKELRSSLIEA